MTIKIIECLECEFPFGIRNTYLHTKMIGERVEVKRQFTCPYCQEKHDVGKLVKLVEISGGVNIKGSNIVSFGDIVGGDLVRNG